MVQTHWSLATPAERIAAYRSHHRIAVTVEQHQYVGQMYRCDVDGIRIHPTRDGRWRHDSAELAALLDQEYGGPWGARKYDAIERLVAITDYDLDEDEEPEFDREGQPEFNGSFR